MAWFSIFFHLRLDTAALRSCKRWSSRGCDSPLQRPTTWAEQPTNVASSSNASEGCMHSWMNECFVISFKYISCLRWKQFMRKPDSFIEQRLAPKMTVFSLIGVRGKKFRASSKNKWGRRVFQTVLPPYSLLYIYLVSSICRPDWSNSSWEF